MEALGGETQAAECHRDETADALFIVNDEGARGRRDALSAADSRSDMVSLPVLARRGVGVAGLLHLSESRRE
jgi:hypothetical protein